MDQPSLGHLASLASSDRASDDAVGEDTGASRFLDQRAWALNGSHAGGHREGPDGLFSSCNREWLLDVLRGGDGVNRVESARGSRRLGFERHGLSALRADMGGMADHGQGLGLKRMSPLCDRLNLVPNVLDRPLRRLYHPYFGDVADKGLSSGASCEHLPLVMQLLGHARVNRLLKPLGRLHGRQRVKRQAYGHLLDRRACGMDSLGRRGKRPRMAPWR
jgi:hypothetical protein